MSEEERITAKTINEATWREFLGFVSRDRVTLLPYLQKVQSVNWNGTVLTLAVPSGYFRDYLKQNASLVADVASVFFDRPISITILPAPREKVTERPVRVGRGAKLSRSETVTIRLDPKLRYIAELASRRQRRTLSSFSEFALEDCCGRVYVRDGYPETFSSVASELWDVEEPDRFAKLAFRYPELLTHVEQVLFKLLKENGRLWKGHFAGNPAEYVWVAAEDSLLIEELRRYWTAFNRVARGELDRSILPTWKRYENDVYEES